MLTLNQLRTFLEMARPGSLTEAADALKMSQASISEPIRRLEDDHDVQLFVRGRRQHVLASAGQELLVYAETAVPAAEHGSRAPHWVTTLTGGVATFGDLRNGDYYLLSGLVQRFVEMHPSVRVRLIGLNSVHVAASVSEQILEAGFIVLPIDPHGLPTTPWARDDMMCASSEPARASGPVTVEELARRRLILYDAHAGWRDPPRRRLADRPNAAGVHLEPSIEVEHVETVLSLVTLGIGDTIASPAVLAGHRPPPNLTATSIDRSQYDTLAFTGAKRPRRPTQPESPPRLGAWWARTQPSSRTGRKAHCSTAFVERCPVMCIVWDTNQSPSTLRPERNPNFTYVGRLRATHAY